MRKIITLAPGRTCLFGDHQDYLGLPVIACAIDRYIKLEAIENNSGVFNISKPDIGKRRKIAIDSTDEQLGVKGDHLLSALKVLKKYKCIPNKGYDVAIKGNIPINAGISSSSAVVVSWVQFLLEAFGCNREVTAEFIAQIAYQTEVVEQGTSGGKMDQYSISLGNIIYLETGEDFSYQTINASLPGLIIGESGIPKDTVGFLKESKSKALLSIAKVKELDSNFSIKTAEEKDINKYIPYLSKSLQPYFYAAISNHEITKKALITFQKEKLNYEVIGSLMNEHHKILRDLLKVTVPKIDKMINGALYAGALGAKIVGSGRGGSIVVLSPQGKEQAVIDGIKKAGAIDAYPVSVVSGVKVLENNKF